MDVIWVFGSRAYRARKVYLSLKVVLLYYKLAALQRFEKNCNILKKKKYIRNYTQFYTIKKNVLVIFN